MADISGQKIDLGNAGMQTPMGLQFALPQTLQKVTKKSWSSQGTEYDPNKMQALRDALGLPRPKMTWQEALANTLSQAQNPQAFTGGFGEQFIDPWGTGFASLARGFGNTYGVRAANAREIAEKEREDAIKMAELENEAAKRTVSSQVVNDYMKVNNPNAKTPEDLQKEQQRKEAELDALIELHDLAQSGEIVSGNKETGDWWLTGQSSKNIGRRNQAISSLVPGAVKIAKDSGMSGINTLGEIMTNVGLPENPTSKQLEGALPGLVKKYGLEEQYYKRLAERGTPAMTPINSSNAKPFVVNGYQIIPE